jgi:hypothetical protein
MVSKHYNRQRYKREKFINKCCNGDGKVVDEFIVDKGHINGLERHCVTDTGMIVIYNLNSGKLVTKLIARVGQIKRYYYGTDREPPASLLRLAEWHESLGYNR